MYNYTPDKIIASLAENNYFANRRIAYAVLNVLRDDASPLLIEGDPRRRKDEPCQSGGFYAADSSDSCFMPRGNYSR